MLHPILLKCLILFYVLVPLTVFSQQDFITGQLVDKGNGEPIVFATIRVKGRAIGVISNLDGSFRIPEKFKEFGGILEIASLGYVSKDIHLFDLATDKTNLIRLDPAIEYLDEVVVEGVRLISKRSGVGKKMSAGKIVRKAIDNIELNYPTKPFTTIGYYRDFQMDEGKYTNLNEAILEVWDQGFGTLDHENTKVKIFENKRNLDFPIDSMARKPYEYINRDKVIPGLYLDNYGGNEFTILRIHDALRNNSISAYDYVNVFKTDFIRNHYFKKEDEVVLNNRKLYKISFRKNIKLGRIKGNLFISKENFALYKFEYAMYSNHQMSSGKRKHNKNQMQKEVLFGIVVGYTPINGLMYPNYHSMKNTFNVKQPPKFKVNQVQYNLRKRYVVISFNNKVNENDAVKKNRYRLEFKGKRIKIDRIVHIENEVLLYPNPEIAASILEVMAQADKKDSMDGSIFNIKVKNLRDIDGNLINEPFYRQLKQYREFFVQRVATEPEAMRNDSLFMNKDTPLFGKQPISRPDNFSDYWMNTPLPNIEN